MYVLYYSDRILFKKKKLSLKKTQKIIWMFRGNRLAKLYGRYVLRRSYV